MKKRPKECANYNKKLLLSFYVFASIYAHIKFFFVYQIISQFFGLRMVWEIWNSLLESYQGKIIPDNARHLGQVGVVRLSLRALGWVWVLLCGMGACSEDALAT